MSKDDIQIRPITKEDVEFFAKSHPECNPFGRTIRGWTVTLNGTPVCIAGVTIGRDFIEAFSDMMPVKVSKRTIWRYAQLLRDNIAALRLPVIVLSGNDKFLRKLGFHVVAEAQGKKIYRLKENYVTASPGPSRLP